MWRLFLRFFANNEQLVEQLSRSPAIRRAAELTVYNMLRLKQFGQKHVDELVKSQSNDVHQHGSKGIAARLFSLSRRLSSELKVGVKEIEEELKQRSKPH